MYVFPKRHGFNLLQMATQGPLMLPCFLNYKGKQNHLSFVSIKTLLTVVKKKVPDKYW